MRNILKATTLESKFPLLAVEGGCIISKDADITVVYRVELPELFTVTSAEYEAIHAAWCKALKVLPEYSVVHKQDWFIRERYRPATGEGDMSFLSRSYERHFNERPFLTHACFLYLTKTTRERMHMRSDFSTLCRGNIIPKEVNREAATKFLEAAEQFERILNDSGFLTLVRLTGDEITGTADCPGLLERYFSLSLSETTSLQDIELGAEVLRVGNKRVCLRLPLPAYPLGHGRPAGARGYGHPLRASFHRPFGLPALVRGPRGASAFLRPPLQPVRVPGRQRRKPAYVRETCA